MRAGHSGGSGDGRKWSELRDIWNIEDFVTGMQCLQAGASENLPVSGGQRSGCWCCSRAGRGAWWRSQLGSGVSAVWDTLGVNQL